MKRSLIAIVLVATMIISLAGFTAYGFSEEVPDLMIKWLVEDYVAELENKPESYSYDVKHNLDSGTKTDSITVTLTVLYPNNDVQAVYTGIYQYNKSTELWSLIRGGEWMELELKQNENLEDISFWASELSALDLSTVSLIASNQKDIDSLLSTANITGDYNIESAWVLAGTDSVLEVSDETPVMIVYFKLPDKAQVDLLYSYCYQKIVSGAPIDVVKEEEGARFHYNTFGNSTEGIYITFVKSDHSLYLIESTRNEFALQATQYFGFNSKD